jgi:hypothetical protein
MPSGPLPRLAVIALLTLLAACEGGPLKAVHKGMFIATTGTTPASRAQYREIAGSERIGRPPPALPTARYRPGVLPPGDPQKGRAGEALGGLIADFGALRQRLSDRDDEFAAQRRRLNRNLRRYLEKAGGVKLQPGDPLPAYDEAYRLKLKDLRDILARVTADTALVNNTVQLAGPLVRAARAQRRRAAAFAAGTGLTGRNKVLAAGLVKALDASIKAAVLLDKDANVLLGKLIEYTAGQRRGLDRLERQVRTRGTDE